MKHKGRKTKEENKTIMCSLCYDDTKKEKVHIYVGGFCGHAHSSCMEIAQNAIKHYERYVLWCYKILPEIQKSAAINRRKGKK